MLADGVLSEQLAAQYSADQRMIAATLSRDLVQLLRALFSFTDPGQSWPAVKMASGAMIRDRRQTSASSASFYYRRARLAAGLPDAVATVAPSQLQPDRVDANLNATGIASYARAVRAGQTPEKALDTMAVTMTGAATQLALEGGREVVARTVDHDRKAIGWARVTDGNPCAFCAMLASRGAVYRTEKTAGRTADKRFTGDGMFKFHNHDGCNAIPVFDHDDPVLDQAEQLYDQWLSATDGHSGKAAINAWKTYWDSRTADPGAVAATPG